MDVQAAKLIAAGICMGLGAIGSAIGEGYIGGKAMEALSRNPKVSDKLIPNMLVAMAITESTAVYSLVVTLIILFAI
jgi:F-type H+-transporting ATPase subunit c